MNNKTPRREFLAGSIAFASALAVRPEGAFAAGEMQRKPGVKLRLALNAYSFNRPLMNGSMTLSDVVDYCSANNIDGLDATGYYFPGYPNVPADDYIYALKRSAYLDGVTISGAGVRNDLRSPTPPAGGLGLTLLVGVESASRTSVEKSLDAAR